MHAKRYTLKTKVLALTISVLGLTGLLAACGDDGDDTPSTTARQVTTQRPATTTARPATTTIPAPLG